jgi:hypothetical protein
MEHTGQSPDERPAEQRDATGKDIPPDPTLTRQGDRHGAGADTPSGPNARSNTDAAKRDREKQEKIKQEDERKASGEKAD